MVDVGTSSPSPIVEMDEAAIMRARTEEYWATLNTEQQFRNLMLNARRDELWKRFSDSVLDIHKEFPGLLERVVREVVFLKYPRAKWGRLEARLEGWIRKNPEWTPNRLAGHAQWYFKMDSRMRPFLIAVSRRIKNRLRMRVKRARGGGEPPEIIPPCIQTT